MRRLFAGSLLFLLSQFLPAQQRDLMVETITVQRRLALVIGNAAYGQARSRTPSTTPTP